MPLRSLSAKTMGAQSLNIFKIPLSCLSGQMSAGEKASTSPGTGQGTTLLAPVAGNGDRSPSTLKRSPLIRTKRVACSLPSDKVSQRDIKILYSGPLFAFFISDSLFGFCVQIFYSPRLTTSKMCRKTGSKHIKGSKERLFIITQTHNLQIFGVITFVKRQNCT